MITEAATGTYCNYCQDAWGGNRVDGVWVWHLKAKTQAKITIISEKRSNEVRSYCSIHLRDIQSWTSEPRFYSIMQQVKDA